MQEFRPEDLTRDALIVQNKELKKQLDEAESVINKADMNEIIEYARRKKVKKLKEAEKEKDAN